MAQILGGANPQPNKPQIDLSKATEMECQECKGTVFIPANKFLKVSKIVTGTPNDAIIPVELYLCGDCGEIVQELLPEQLKKKQMTIKDYRKFLNALPTEFDDYELVHREYTDITDDVLNAQEVEVYSVHIDETEKTCCNMHMESYELI